MKIKNGPFFNFLDQWHRERPQSDFCTLFISKINSNTMNRILTAHKAVNDFCTIATYNMYIINKVIKRSQYQHINKDVCSIGKGILTYPEEISEYFLSERIPVEHFQRSFPTMIVCHTPSSAIHLHLSVSSSYHEHINA